MKILWKWLPLCSLILSVSACTPPESQANAMEETPEVLATGDDSSLRPDNDRD